MSDEQTTHYAERDPQALGGYYLCHIAAMTAEGLHEKSAIAAELAFRDARIAELERALAECEHQTHSLRVWNGGEYAYHPPQAERIAKIARAAIEKATKP